MKAKEIITAFKQGKAGNCVSIAVIKAAIMHYGIDNIFKSTSFKDGTYNITMRDGFQTKVRDHEIEKAQKHSRFNKGSNELIRQKANLYFTAMAKRVYVEGAIDIFLGRKTLKNALKSLNNGENYLEGIKWLGLNCNYNKININELSLYSSAIGVSSKHCFFIGENGKLIDNYGKVSLWENAIKSEAFKLKHIIVLT